MCIIETLNFDLGKINTGASHVYIRNSFCIIIIIAF
jgi:hypothetical protein